MNLLARDRLPRRVTAQQREALDRKADVFLGGRESGLDEHSLCTFV